MSRGLRAPIADVFGDSEALPALSCRASETEVVFLGAVAATGQIAVVANGGTIEISIENAGAAPAVVSFIATDDPPDLGALRAQLLANEGFRRRVPAGGQVVEIRAVEPGDTVFLTADADVVVRIHVHVGAT